MPRVRIRTGMRAARRWVLTAIRDSGRACVDLSELVRAGAIAGVGRARATSAIGDLIARGWLATWSPPGGGPVLATFTPRAAHRLGLKLSEGEVDYSEPRWVRAWEAEGPARLATDPLHARRSPTRFERIAAAYPAREPAAAEQAAHDELVMIAVEAEGRVELRPLVLMGVVVHRDLRMEPGRRTA